MGFRPALVPTIVVAAALFVLVNLGLWQLDRHQQTNERLARIDAQLREAPLDARGILADPEEIRWRLAEVRGRYLDVPPAVITARFEFGSPGYDIVQPLQVHDGPLVLVNRGWLPAQDFERHLADVRPDGEVTVRGLVQPVDGDPDATPIPARDHYPERWARPNYAAMARAWGLTPQAVLVEGASLTHPDQKKSDVLPVTGFIARPRVRPHLEYAGTWFLIAVALVGLWIYAGVQRARRLEDQSPS